MSAKLISIIGPPAAGKTTLAEALAERLDGEVIYEDYAGNPFLAASYLGDPTARLPAQLYYLMSRVKQLALPSWPERGLRISDYGFCHDRVYARRQLAAEEWNLYDRVARRLETRIKPPDLLIHVDAAEDELLRRIGSRGRAFEGAMNADFLAELRRAYEAISGETAAVIRLSADAMDFRDAPAMDALAGRVREQL